MNGQRAFQPPLGKAIEIIFSFLIRRDANIATAPVANAVGYAAVAWGPNQAAAVVTTVIAVAAESTKLKKLRFFVACAHPTNPRGQQRRFNSANVPHGNRRTALKAAVYNISTHS